MCALIPLTCMAGAFELAMLVVPSFMSELAQVGFGMFAGLLIGLAIKLDAPVDSTELKTKMMYIALGAATMTLSKLNYEKYLVFVVAQSCYSGLLGLAC